MEKKPCPRCGREITVKNDGQPRKHNSPGSERPCVPGDTPVTVRGGLAGRRLSDPAPTVDDMDDSPAQQELADIGYVGVPDDEPQKGPWFGAMYEGRCSDCEYMICEGDRIRADGKGGYECEDCGEEPGPVAFTARPSDIAHLPSPDAKPQVTAVTERRIPAAPGPMPTPDQFLSPAPVERFPGLPDNVPTPDEFLNPSVPDVKLNVSGQPPARRDHLKRYIVIDPHLGDFRRTKKERKPFGISRATTFNKHAQNTIALNQWSKRNVVMGASLRPDILRRAHGLTHDNGKDELNRIVDELETAAGAKVAADEGSFLHEFCDQVDAGLKTWQDAPAAYQQDIKRYVEALAEAGLEPVPGLIERTTFIREYGGVAGTFDRVFYHRPSGQYIIGDLKTGKTMKYAMDETECQEWTYAHGVNQTGIYDWNTDTWRLAFGHDGPITVSEKVGVIIHMPVQGPEAGEVYLRFANLERGRAYADLNNAVKSYEKSKVLPFEMPFSPEEQAGSEDRWEALFRGARTSQGATALWRRAKAEGIQGDRLNELIAIARQSIQLHSWSDKG